jgi:phosphoribosylformylglycinamidine synthase
MSLWLARVQVTLKPVVNDPEGLSVADALHQLGFDGVRSVRAGKYFEIEVEADDRDAAGSAADAMCRRLLANPVVERYRFTLGRRSARPAAPRARR